MNQIWRKGIRIGLQRRKKLWGNLDLSIEKALWFSEHKDEPSLEKKIYDTQSWKQKIVQLSRIYINCAAIKYVYYIEKR